ncbi:hypothetical protein WR25_13042 isoform A [Diploscapter pachys]|uniref:Uncharacterized protein n=1 Tax=Diploscapter pachys TaxID=2018661 RepID=A0A2A2JUE2_9BILA|nr:hypothetical protein WR25_13042 isoform A [Diploscapter pachys]
MQWFLFQSDPFSVNYFPCKRHCIDRFVSCGFSSRLNRFAPFLFANLMVAIGIDLGTTQCVVAFKQSADSPVEIISNSYGRFTTPSVVAYEKNGAVQVGESAYHVLKGSKDVGNVLYDSKRLIGRQFYDQSVQDDMKFWQFNIVNKDGKPLYEVKQDENTRHIAPEQVSAEILSQLKADAEKRLEAKVTDCVITVPANFNRKQRIETKRAAELTGMNVLRLLNEPTAAAIAHGVKNSDSKVVLIYDLGGGTFDVSIVRKIDKSKLMVLGVDGHAHLGGQDFDNVLVDYYMKRFEENHGYEYPNNPKMLRNLRAVCIDAKEQLSHNRTIADVFVGNVLRDIDLNYELTRDLFNELCGDLFHATLSIIDSVLEQAHLTAEEIDQVLLVGGSSRIVYIQHLIGQKFGRDKISQGVHPEHAIAQGAAIMAFDLWEQNKPSTSTSKKPQFEIHEIIPLSLGIGLRFNLFEIAIPRGTIYPCKNTILSATSHDYQTSSEFFVYEGERANVKKNFKIGKVHLKLQHIGPAGKELATTFLVDANGILHVTELEKDTDNCTSIAIQYDGSAHSEVDIRCIVNEATNNKQEDDEFTEFVQLRYDFENKLYKAKRAVEENLALSEDQKKEILSIIDDDFINKSCDLTSTRELTEASEQEFEAKLKEYGIASSKTAEDETSKCVIS